MNRIKKAGKVCEELHVKDKGYKAASNADFALFLVGLVLTMLIIRSFIFAPVRVDGQSMQNTLQDGERCFLEKTGYWFNKPQIGDIVIVHYPDRPRRENFVKRVIATEGQTIQLVEQTETDPETNIVSVKRVVLVDGEPLDESAYEGNMLIDPFFFSEWRIRGAVDGVYTVPQNCIFVMGDHRTNSRDSRSVGAIPLCDVEGCVHYVVYPFTKIRPII